ncbi:MAG TPA: hypothetical protein VEX68_07810 [Bryobacteraceae bacterium]|nr:hypothetical protein [Bryobacteraceae bacterium]
MAITLLNQPVEITSRMSEAAQLERRLEDGYARIEDARLEGINTSDWEEFWIKLLREYEEICNKLAEAA